MPNPAIKRIVIEIGGKEKSLTLKQAEALYAALRELFEKPSPVYPQPVIIEDRRPWKHTPYFWCGTETIRPQTTWRSHEALCISVGGEESEPPHLVQAVKAISESMPRTGSPRLTSPPVPTSEAKRWVGEVSNEHSVHGVKNKYAITSKVYRVPGESEGGDE